MPKPPNTRTREDEGHKVFANVYGKFLTNPITQLAPPVYTTVLSGRQKTVSEGHHWPPPDKGKWSGDRGGDFFTTKTYVATPLPRRSVMKRKDGNWDYTFIGNFYPFLPSTANDAGFPPIIASSNDALDEMGATAIARCKPTNSPADLSTFLGELMKEGLPSLVGSSFWKSKSQELKGLPSVTKEGNIKKTIGEIRGPQDRFDPSRSKLKGSGEYLNVQFGWMPVINEVRNFANTVKKADQILAQYERDAGRLVRRNYEFPLQRTISESIVATNVTATTAGAASGSTQSPLGAVTRKRETLRKTWFSGAFTYHLPTGYDSRLALERYAARADVLFGTTPSPETLWNIAPWSWAVDWFSNTGDVISNLQDFASSGLVMRYGYVMETTITKDTYTLSESGLVDRSLGKQPLILVRETKVRRKANPFGFGVKWEGLSPFQLSIAAALGINRSSR